MTTPSDNHHGLSGSSTQVVTSVEKWMLDQLFDTADVGIVFTDTQSRVIRANRYIGAFLGVDHDSLPGTAMVDYLPSETRDIAVSNVQQLVAGAMPSVTVERRYVRGDGTERWGRWQLQACRDSEGAVEGLLGILTDITDQKHAEEIINENLARLLALFDGIDEPVYVSDTETYELVYANRSLRDLLGPVDSRKCYEYLQHRESPCPFCTNDLILGEYLGRSYVWKFQNEANGRWYRCIDKAIPWPDGRTVRYEMAIDISDRIRAESALQEALDRYDLIAQNTTDVIWVLDLATLRFTYVSPSEYRLRGYTPEEALEQSLEQALTPDSLQTALETIAVHVARLTSGDESARTASLELLQPHKDGRLIPVEISATLVTDERGAPVRIIGITRDITERKAAERTLRESENQFRMLADNAPQAIFIQTQMRFAYVNKACVKLWSARSEDDLLGEPVMDRFHPDLHAVIRERIRLLNEEGHAVSQIEQQHVTLSGELIDVEVSAVPFQFKGDNGALVFVTDITARKKAEQAILDRERLTATMFAQTTDAIVLVDAETGRVVDFNQVAHQELGYTREEFFRMSVADFQAELTPDQIALASQDVIAGALRSMVTRHRKKDGTLMDVELTVRPVTMEGRHLISAVWRDITEQKARERGLKDLAERLRLHNELIGRLTRSEAAINGNVVEFAGELTQLLSTSLGIERVSVWRHEEATNSLVCMDLFDADAGTHRQGDVLDEIACRNEFEALKSSRYVDAHDPLTDPRTAGFAEPYLKPLGITSMLDCSVISGGEFRGAVCFEHVNRPHHWEPDEIAFACQVADQIGMALLNQDRIETARALRESEAHLKDAQAVSRTGHWRMDIATGKIVWSDEMYRIFGMAPGAPLAADVFESCLHPEDRDQVITAWKESLGGKSYHMTHRIAAGDEVKWVEVRGSVERDAEGRPMEARGVVQDVTEKVQREQELEKYRWHLEDLVASRTEELEKARIEAEAASRAKGAFVANMSHEIRSPMNAIIGFAHLMKRDPLTARQVDYMDKLTVSAQHLLQVINDILDFSKIEAGKMTLEVHDFEPSRVVDYVCSIVAETVAAKDLELLVCLEEVPPVLQGDELRIGQILLNLVSNAAKFTETGVIEVAVRVLGREGDRVTVRFEVRDTGIGMDEKQKDRLFQSFQQADDSMTRRFGGTGLGLAISKRLVELMGGDMGVESTPGEGSLFWMEIPLGGSTAARKSGDSLKTLKGMRTLIVDDLEVARESLGRTVRELKMRPDTAGSAEDGLAAVARADQEGNPYQLVLMDWKMPGMDGVEMAKQLERLSLRTRPHFLMVTAYGDQLPPEALGEAHISRVLPKPVTPSILLDALKASLHGHGKFDTSRPQGELEQALRMRRGAHVLLVEDSDINQEVASQMLESVGMRVSIAENGQQAVEMAAKNPYDLILMDVQMPVMDGLEATRRIRAMEVRGWRLEVGGQRSGIRGQRTKGRSPTSDIGHRTSSIRHPTSDIGHSDSRHDRQCL